MSSSDILWARAASGMPALFTRIVTRPSWASMSSSSASNVSASMTSSATGPARAPVGADALGQRLELVDAAGGGDDRGAGGREHLGEAPAEAGRRARDEGDLAGEVGVGVREGVVDVGHRRSLRQRRSARRAFSRVLLRPRAPEEPRRELLGQCRRPGDLDGAARQGGRPAQRAAEHLGQRRGGHAHDEVGVEARGGASTPMARRGRARARSGWVTVRCGRTPRCTRPGGRPDARHAAVHPPHETVGSTSSWKSS